MTGRAGPDRAGQGRNSHSHPGHFASMLTVQLVQLVQLAGTAPTGPLACRVGAGRGGPGWGRAIEALSQRG
ncbi:MAG: hypothetical protein HC884_03325 [Chloroflexaceae bacterium]|nr:hypothetical protein [Chloroflexaceae bacterium]